jgi:C1A family cysteine protease
MRVRPLSVVSVVLLGAAVSLGLGACSTASVDDSSSAALASPDGVSLAQVQAAIKAAGANWSAGDNSVSQQPASARKVMLGIPLSALSAERVSIVQEARAASPTPPALDWRANNGKNFVSPILDQGRCGSCVAFATVATFESQLNIAANDPSSPWELSPQYLFSCGGGACSFGWMPSSAARYVVSKGVPDQACMPYTAGAHGDDARCSAACSDASSRVMKAKSVLTPTGGASSVDAVKQALMNGPLLASMTVYEDLMYYTGGVYKHVTGDVAGGHAVSIVGYSDADQAWIVRNSWGTGWGENGFFRIAWGDPSGVGEETYGFNVPAPGPYVAVSDMRDNTVLTGQVPLSFDSQSLGSMQITWTLSNGSTPVQQGVAGAGSSMLDTSTVPDGIYTLQAHASSGVDHVDGPRHIVYVLNGTETGTIKFASLASGQQLTGVAEFDVNVTAAPVPLTHVEWTIVDSSGNTIVTRSTQNTGKVMQLGWNTTRWPNGNYTINVTGGAGNQAATGTSVNVSIHN